jgi:hypothetical protein
MVTVQFVGSGDAFGTDARFQACISLRWQRHHVLLDCRASSAHQAELGSTRLILTHVGPDLLAHRAEVEMDSHIAADGLQIEL